MAALLEVAEFAGLPGGRPRRKPPSRSPAHTDDGKQSRRAASGPLPSVDARPCGPGACWPNIGCVRRWPGDACSQCAAKATVHFIPSWPSPYWKRTLRRSPRREPSQQPIARRRSFRAQESSASVVPCLPSFPSCEGFVEKMNTTPASPPAANAATLRSIPGGPMPCGSAV